MPGQAPSVEDLLRPARVVNVCWGASRVGRRTALTGIEADEFVWLGDVDAVDGPGREGATRVGPAVDQEDPDDWFRWYPTTETALRPDHPEGEERYPYVECPRCGESRFTVFRTFLPAAGGRLRRVFRVERPPREVWHPHCKHCGYRERTHAFPVDP